MHAGSALRLTGWIVAANAVALVLAAGLSGHAGEAARPVSLLCVLAR